MHAHARARDRLARADEHARDVDAPRRIGDGHGRREHEPALGDELPLDLDVEVVEVEVEVEVERDDHVDPDRGLEVVVEDAPDVDDVLELGGLGDHHAQLELGIDQRALEDRLGQDRVAEEGARRAGEQPVFVLDLVRPGRDQVVALQADGRALLADAAVGAPGQPRAGPQVAVLLDVEEEQVQRRPGEPRAVLAVGDVEGDGEAVGLDALDDPRELVEQQSTQRAVQIVKHRGGSVAGGDCQMICGRLTRPARAAAGDRWARSPSPGTGRGSRSRGPRASRPCRGRC